MSLPATTPVAPRIAVIGGGLTGLAAAFRLTELLPRADIQLFEASSRPGGVVDTAHVEGFLIERSADSFLTKLPIPLDLCRRLGIADDLLPTNDANRRALVVRDGRLEPVPEGFYLLAPRRLWPTLSSPIISYLGKLRLLAEPFIARGPATRDQPSHAALPNLSDESVASFARRRLGREVFERLVQPLVAGIYTADPERLSMAATMPEFLALEREYRSLLCGARRQVRRGEKSRDALAEVASGARYSLFVAPKNGLSSIADALAGRLPPESVQLNTMVATVRRSTDNRWHLDLTQPRIDLSESTTDFDAVVLAVPAYVAASLLKSTCADLADELAAIEYSGCVVASFGFDREQISHPLDGFGFVVPQIERRRIIAASFASQKFPGRAPQNAVLIRTFLGGALQPEMLDLPDEEVRQLALAELRELLHVSGDPRVTDIARWPRSMPQYHVGHLTRVGRIEQLAAAMPTLAVAGNAYRGVGIPQCVASAEAAAERIAAALSERFAARRQLG